MEQNHGTESWNRIMEQTRSSAEHTSLKKGWFMTGFNHIIYNDNIKLFLLLLGPDHWIIQRTFFLKMFILIQICSKNNQMTVGLVIKALSCHQTTWMWWGDKKKSFSTTQPVIRFLAPNFLLGPISPNMHKEEEKREKDLVLNYLHSIVEEYVASCFHPNPSGNETVFVCLVWTMHSDIVSQTFGK